MTARIARNNSPGVIIAGDPAEVVKDWNGKVINPDVIVVVDDDNALIRQAVEAGALELDPTLGRHYEAPSTEREVRPTERSEGKADGPRGRL